MAYEPKTRPTDVPVADFIAAVPNPTRRADAAVAVGLLEEVSGETPVMWGPSIVGFGSYRGPTGDWPLLGFSPRGANTVFYLMGGYDGQDDLLARLGKHRIGKSCLYVNRLSDIDLDVLREMARRSMADTRARYPA